MFEYFDIYFNIALLPPSKQIHALRNAKLYNHLLILSDRMLEKGLILPSPRTRRGKRGMKCAQNLLLRKALRVIKEHAGSRSLVSKLK